MKHQLNEEEREHLREIGIPAPPGDLHIDPEEYQRDYRAWQASLPQAGHAEWHKRALAHAGWRQHVRSDRAAAQFHGAHGMLLPTHEHNPWKWALLVILALLTAALLLSFGASKGHAQVTGTKGNNAAAPASNNIGALPCVANAAAPSFTEGRLVFASCDLSGNLRITGSISVGSFTDNGAFTAGSSGVNPAAGWYSSAPTNCTDGSACSVLLTNTRHLWTTCDNCGGTGSTTPADAFANPTTAGMSLAFNAGYNGTTWDLLRSGDVNNKAAATGILNALNIGRYNATQPTLTDTRYNAFQLSSRGELFVAPGVSNFAVQAAQSGTWNIGTVTTLTGITNALPAGTNVIGHVIADTGSTTAVTGNVAVTQADGADVTLGAKADAKSTATDTTAVTIMSVLKEISAMEQAPASRAVTNAGTFAVQAAQSGNWTARVVGNAGGIFDTTQNAAVPANAISMGCNFTTSPASITSGNQGALQCNSKGEALAQLTDGTTNVSVIAGTNALKADLSSIAGTATVTAGVNGMLAVGGNTATNVAITSNPLLIGCQGVSSENTAVTTARGVQTVCDLVGKLIVLPYANPENLVKGVTAAVTDTTSTSTIASAGGSLRNYITKWSCTNSHATVGTFIKLLDGSTIIDELYAAPAGGGFVATYPSPLQGTAATAVNSQAVTTGTNFICSASGYKGL